MDIEKVYERLAALEERVRFLDDQAELLRLIAGWGPAADTGNGRAASSFWTEDAVLETETSRVEGPSGVRAKIDSDTQEAMVRQGCAHVQGLPVLHIDGDHATAINYGRVYLHTDHGYETWRVSVNCWEFRRTEEGWRAKSRIVQVIDGGSKARALLSRVHGAEGAIT